MAHLRYVKTAEEVKASREGGAEFLESTVSSIRIVY